MLTTIPDVHIHVNTHLHVQTLIQSLKEAIKTMCKPLFQHTNKHFQILKLA